MESKLSPSAAFGDLLLAAAARRAELAQTYLTAPTVQALLGIDQNTLMAWREDKRLLGVWHETNTAWLYPDFQFDQNGLIEHMPRILAVFDKYYSHVWKDTWGIVEWFLSPHALLDDRRPMDLMATSPQFVLRAALVELGEDPTTY